MRVLFLSNTGLRFCVLDPNHNPGLISPVYNLNNAIQLYIGI